MPDRIGIGDLERFNPWWRTGKVREEWLEDYRRKLYSEIDGYLGRRQMILVWGMRRVGKTVLMFQVIQGLLESVEPKNVLYFSFDEIEFDLRDVLESYQKLVLNRTFDDLKGKVYLFLDEVHKVKDWENKIKAYYDLYPNLKIFLSGSASVRMRKGSRESLAGRIFDFEMRPLDFEEFLGVLGKDPKKARENPGLWEREIVPLFYRYMKYGAFPEIAKEDNEEFARKYITSNIIERVIYKDLPEEFGIKDTGLLKSLVYMLGKTPGMVVDYKEISKNLGKDQRTVARYFEYLEFGLLVKFVFNYRGSPLASTRKLKKAYFTTPNIIFAFSQNLEQALPLMLENLVLAETGAVFFYRNSFELDFVLEKNREIVAIEVKTGGSGAKQIRKFASKFRNVKKSFVVSMEKEAIEEGIKTVPAWKFVLLKPYTN